MENCSSGPIKTPTEHAYSQFEAFIPVAAHGHVAMIMRRGEASEWAIAHPNGGNNNKKGRLQAQ